MYLNLVLISGAVWGRLWGDGALLGKEHHWEQTEFRTSLCFQFTLCFFLVLTHDVSQLPAPAAVPSPLRDETPPAPGTVN